MGNRLLELSSVQTSFSNIVKLSYLGRCLAGGIKFADNVWGIVLSFQIVFEYFICFYDLACI